MTVQPPPQEPPPGQPAQSSRRGWSQGGLVGFLILLAVIFGPRLFAAHQNQKLAPLAADGNASTTATNSSPSATVSVGQEVRDGKFAFTVTSVDPPVPTIGNRTAQGQFIVVHLDVKNIGNAGQTFFAKDQKLIDANHKQYSSDDNAEQKLDELQHSGALVGNPLMTAINPGNAVDTAVVFDVPQGVQPAAIEVHESMLSGGATVELPQLSSVTATAQPVMP